MSLFVAMVRPPSPGTDEMVQKSRCRCQASKETKPELLLEMGPVSGALRM